MSAHADDLRHYYAEHIGPSVVVAVTALGALSPQLAPGRYMLHTKAVAGSTALWVRQGTFGKIPAAVAAAPCTPLDLEEDPRHKITFMVRAAGVGAGTERTATDGLALITNAGTVDAVITRISR